MFGLSPRVFTPKKYAQVGELIVLDTTSGITITDANIDSDDPEIYERFTIGHQVMNYPNSEPDEWWEVVWRLGEMAGGMHRFEVPVYIEYVNEYGDKDNWRGSFVVYGKGADAKKPVVQYINNIATKVGTTEYVTIYGHNFDDDLSVFLDRPDGTCVALSGTDLIREYDTKDGYDTISFIFGKPFVAMDSTCNEICGTYAINLGYGECGAYSAEAGSSDYETAWNNNLYLIRYRYDSVNKELSEQTPGGSMTTVDPKCFYTTELELVTDDYSSDSKTASGGVTSNLGSSIYFKIKPNTDCTKLAYYRVKLKYSRNLPKRAGELTLDGIPLTEGELVWLDKQFDGGNGLWIVQTGEWIGLKTYLDGQGGHNEYYNPCQRVEQEPLAVDSNVIADLGVHVKDKVTVTCDSDVPEERRYGTQKICNTIVRPGDTVLLTNQSDGTNGIWEVTCAEWVQRTEVIPEHSGTSISGDDFVVAQNDIDFCTCEHGGKNIFHIWYYYLNGACYLSRASRTVKITCGLNGTLFPSKGVDVSDYRISVEANPELITDTHRTAGDPVKETCAEEVENYDADYRVDIKDSRFGCGDEVITAPNGLQICRCKHVYNLDGNTLFSSRDRTGFSIVFWQYDDSDGRWHLYAYIGAGRYDLGMNYYVYHLCTNGIASEADVDENSEILPLGADGLPMKDMTHDAWFVTHGGRLADGFGMFDDTWSFKVVDEETDEVSYVHELNEKTLYSMWAIKCTTTICAKRAYSDNSILRTTCADMNDAEKTSSVMVDAEPTPDTWGFKFYSEVLSKARLCGIWNSMPH